MHMCLIHVNDVMYKCTRKEACDYYKSITIVQSYTGKYHEFVAVCIVMSASNNANGNKRVICHIIYMCNSFM